MPPHQRLTSRQWAFDIALAVAVLTIGVIASFADFANPPNIEFSRDADAFHYSLIVLMAAPLALRRVYPIPVLAVILGAWVIDRGLDYPDTPSAFGVFIAFYTIGAELDKRRSALVGGISSAVVLGWTSLGVVTLESVSSVALFTTAIATITPLLLGREIHDRRQRVEELRKRAERAEQEREERAKQAVLEERSRIARELHDVVAHQMTVMTLQAEGASRIASDGDPRLVEALETIRVAGHSALTEMRRTVGLLRSEEDDIETQPLPRLDDIKDLVSQMQSAGVEIDVNVEGTRRRLTDGAELAAYRIVQESLTNAVRHGGPDVSAEVHLTFSDDQLDIEVVDDGRAQIGDGSDGGHGIIGMRERVAVLGGEFEAGPKLGGGYRVHAIIPVQE